jgi:hypothetical protein
MSFPGWSVESTHPCEVSEEVAESSLCAICANAIEYSMAFASSWGSTTHQHSITDGDDVSHVVVVRQNG